MKQWFASKIFFSAFPCSKCSIFHLNYIDWCCFYSKAGPLWYIFIPPSLFFFVITFIYSPSFSLSSSLSFVSTFIYLTLFAQIKFNARCIHFYSKMVPRQWLFFNWCWYENTGVKSCDLVNYHYFFN